MVRDFAYRFRVRQDELDSFAHLNNAVCVKYMQEAAIQGSTDAGYALQWYEERGVAWVVRRLEIRYYLQVRYGDELEVRTWISECRSEERRVGKECRARWGEEEYEEITDDVEASTRY